MTTIGMVLGAGLLLAALWLGWRRPDLLFVLAMASLAVRPELVLGGPELAVGWGLSRTLVVLALVANGVRHGVRKDVNWPVLALAAVAVLGPLLGDLHRRIGVEEVLVGLAILALPWTFTQVVLAPGSRRACALAIALAPLLSVAAGLALQALGIRPLFAGWGGWGGVQRLEGATGNAAVFALLAFAGFAVALHESTRPGRPYAGPLAAVNLVLVILSGTRMGIAAAAAFLAAYALLSPGLRERWRRHRRGVLIAGGAVAVAAAAYAPVLWRRLFLEGGADSGLRLSGRGELWRFYFEEFLFSPLFGRGIGAGFIAGDDYLGGALNTPHNEYLHLLVIGGVAGFALAAAAIALWYRQLVRAASPNDRPYLLALLPAAGLYAVTDNVLVYPTGLALFAYFGVLLTAPSRRPRTAPTRRRTPPRPGERAPADERGAGGSRRWRPWGSQRELWGLRRRTR